MERELQRTPLEQEHLVLGAKMGEFGGWLMPIEYEGVMKEHTAVREAVGVFDLTHLGKIDVRGPGALDHLQRVVTGDLAKVEPGAAQYGLVLNEDGGIVDDLIVYRRDDDDFLVVPNAANTQRVLAILVDGAGPGVAVDHRTDLVTIAVQGPRALELIGALLDRPVELPFMACETVSFREALVLLARSGYTGEPGVELFAPQSVARALWGEVMAGGEPLEICACGLGARDTLRLEMGYPLHGNDISEERTPLEAGLSWAVAMEKGPFTGRDALLRQQEEGVAVRLRGLRMSDKRIPRPGFTVTADGEKVGETTSGSFSPTLRVGIGMAYLEVHVEPGATVEVDVRGRRSPAEVVRPPFVDRSPKGA